MGADCGSLLAIAMATLSQGPMSEAELGRRISRSSRPHQLANASIDPVRREQLRWIWPRRRSGKRQAVTRPTRSGAVNVGRWRSTCRWFSRETPTSPWRVEAPVSGGGASVGLRPTWHHAGCLAEPGETRFPRAWVIALFDDVMSDWRLGAECR